MQHGFLTIVTTVDGEESRFSCKAEMELSSLSALLRYNDGNAEVTVSLSREEVTIFRSGDYSMRLVLREGEQTLGTLILGGNEGQLCVYTQKASYCIRKGGLLVQLHYVLNFGEEKQEMRLRMNASMNSSEEK